jgi:hypothetical protein
MELIVSDFEPWFVALRRNTWAQNGSNRHDVYKPRCSAGSHNDIPHDQRAMDRDATIHQIVLHQNFGPWSSFRACLL